MQAGDIILGMPKHKINANVTYNLFKDLDITAGLNGATGVLRGDESNQLKRLLLMLLSILNQNTQGKMYNFLLELKMF